jgi:hypothetical protein
MDDIEGFSVVTKKIKKRIYFPKKKKKNLPCKQISSPTSGISFGDIC